MKEEERLSTITLNQGEFNQLLVALEAQATRYKYATDYELLALMEKIKASKQFNDRQDKVRG